jgi:type I restriction enzyme S subunit
MTTDTLTDTVASPPHAPTYPAHWRMARLGDFIAANALTLTNGFAQGGFNEEGQGVPHLRPFNVTDDGRIDLQHIKSVPAPRADSSYWIRQGDIIFNNTNSEDLVGKTAYFPHDGKYVLSNHMTRIRVVDSRQVDAAWLAYQFLLQWDHRVFKALCRRHVGQASISLDKLSNLTLPLPSLAEQRAIACILRAAQDAIAARRREVTLERERKAALMQRLFTHGVRGEPTKQTEIGEMPQSWQVVRLGDALVKTQYGLSLRGESVGDYPILRMNNLVEGHVDTADLQYVTTDDTILRQFQLAHGDILFNRTNSYELVGKTALFDLPGKFLFASYLIRVIPLPEILLSGFLNAYFNTARTQQRLRMLASRGVSQSNISASKLQEFFIPLPSLDEQRAIADTLAACDTHIAALEREIALHEELFRALLEELMSGRLSALPLVEGKEVND